MALANNVIYRILKTSNLEISYFTGEERIYQVTEYAVVNYIRGNGWVKITPFYIIKELQNGYFPVTLTKRINPCNVTKKIRWNNSLLGYYDAKTKLIWNKLPQDLTGIDLLANDAFKKFLKCRTEIQREFIEVELPNQS